MKTRINKMSYLVFDNVWLQLELFQKHKLLVLVRLLVSSTTHLSLLVLTTPTRKLIVWSIQLTDVPFIIFQVPLNLLLQSFLQSRSYVTVRPKYVNISAFSISFPCSKIILSIILLPNTIYFVLSIFSSNPYHFLSSFHWFTNISIFPSSSITCTSSANFRLLNLTPRCLRRLVPLCWLYPQLFPDGWRHKVMQHILVLCLCLYGTILLFLYLLLWRTLHFYLRLSIMQSVYSPLHMIPVQPMSHSDQCCQILLESLQNSYTLCFKKNLTPKTLYYNFGKIVLI